MFWRIIIVVLLVLLIPLQVSLWGKDGWLRLNTLNNSIARQQQENEQMKQRNKVLLREVYDLKTSSAAMEELAREKLEMIKRDEVLFRLIHRRQDSAAADRPAP